MPRINAAIPTTGDRPPDASAEPARVIVENRFGCYEFTEENTVHLPNGLLGFAHARRLGLANLPDPRLEHYKLLQSLEQAELCFIVTPLPDHGEPFETAELDELCATAAIPRKDAVFLLVVTIRRQDEGITMTVNLRAPIVFDPVRHLARQCVVASNKYPVQQPFFGWNSESQT